MLMCSLGIWSKQERSPYVDMIILKPSSLCLTKRHRTLIYFFFFFLSLLCSLQEFKNL